MKSRSQLVFLLVLAFAVIEDPLVEAMSFRRQDERPGHYLVSSGDLSGDFAGRSEFLSSDFEDVLPPVPKEKESRYSSPQLTSEEALRQARRERNRVLLGGNRAQDLLKARSGSAESSFEIGAENRHGENYEKESDKGKGVDTFNRKSRPTSTPENGNQDDVEEFGTTYVRSYNKYEQKLPEKNTPDSLRGFYKNKELKENDQQGKTKAYPRDDAKQNNVKTISMMLKDLRAERKYLDQPSNYAIEGRKDDSFSKGRAEEAKKRTSTRTNDEQVTSSAGVEVGIANSKAKENVRNNGFRSREEVKIPDRMENGLGPKEQSLKLIEELDALEEISQLHRGFNHGGGKVQYYEIRQELADAIRDIRSKVKQVLREELRDR